VPVVRLRRVYAADRCVLSVWTRRQRDVVRRVLSPAQDRRRRVRCPPATMHGHLRLSAPARRPRRLRSSSCIPVHRAPAGRLRSARLHRLRLATGDDLPHDHGLADRVGVGQQIRRRLPRRRGVWHNHTAASNSHPDCHRRHFVRHLQRAEVLRAPGKLYIGQILPRSVLNCSCRIEFNI